MHTQNIKTAAAESSRRWGTDTKARLACLIREQKAYFSRLRGICERQLSEEEEAERIFGILYAMSENIHKKGGLGWLQAKAMAASGFGRTGKEACVYANHHLKNSMKFELAMIDLDNR